MGQGAVVGGSLGKAQAPFAFKKKRACRRPAIQKMASTLPSKVFLLPSAGASGAAPGEAALLTLRHPRTGRAAQYMLLPASEGAASAGADGGDPPAAMMLCEVQAGAETVDNGAPLLQPTSWFIGHRVCSDGALYLATPVDPLFLLLPVLHAARAKASPLDQLLDGGGGGGGGGGCPDLKSLRRALPADPRTALALLCEVNDQYGDDLLLYRLDEGKALRWLVAKAQQFKAALAAHAARDSAACAAAARAAGEGGDDVALGRSSHVATFKTSSSGSRTTAAAATASPGGGGGGGAGTNSADAAKAGRKRIFLPDPLRT